MILSPLKIDIGSMTKKEKVMKLVDESTGLMECLVCGAKAEQYRPKVRDILGKPMFMY